MGLPEDFLHYLWKFRLFRQQGLGTITGEPLEILDTGMHNLHAGPDFEGARIRIGDTVWAGNIEIHIRSSDWNKHRHQHDRAYDNVILHVVAIHDMDITRTDGTYIPVLSLQGLIPIRLSQNYRDLAESMDWIPCSRQIGKVDPLYIRNWLQRVGIERLEEKAENIYRVLDEYKGSWDDAFYVCLARNFGFRTNAMPFEMLARSLSRQLLDRYKNKSLYIEALVFGQAGFLDQEYSDAYPELLRREYLFLRKKHSLVPLDNYLWKYMRLRPANFPNRRLAQFAALLINSAHLFSRILEGKDVYQIRQMFMYLPVNAYWQDHSRFDASCAVSSAALGKQTADNILVNTVSPFLMAYGRMNGLSRYISASLNLLGILPPETNAIINCFKEAGLKPDSAFFSQSLMQLKKNYCDHKKCLSCGVGMKLLNI